MRVKKSLMLWVAVFALALPLLLTGTASAKYMSDGAVPDGSGGWKTPNDGICVVGVHADGTMDVDASITSKRDCIYYTTGLTSMTTSTACTIVGGAGNDGAKHQWATSFCTGSLKDLDRTQQMCEAKYGAGAWITTGKCVAYNWLYRGQNAAGAPLAFGSGTKGTDASQNAGFCYAQLRTGSTVTANCPSVTGATGSGTATSTAAFGYSFSSGKCLYDYGINGAIAKALTAVDNTVTAAGTVVDLSLKTTYGECLAAGGSWANWIPKNGTGTDPIGGTITIATFDLTRQAVNADEGCLHCHSSIDQANGPAERQKDSALKTGHKNMLRKVTAGSVWAGPNASGVIEVYTNATGTIALNFTNATATGPWSGSVDLLYLFGDWMAPAPAGLDVVVNIGGFGKYNGTSNYSCAACHSEGWSNTDPAAGLCTLSSYTTAANCTGNGGVWTPLSGVQAIGTPGYAAKQPVDSFPSVTFTGAGQWDNEGISCGRCHNAMVPSVTRAQISGGTCAYNSTSCVASSGTWTTTSGGSCNLPSIAESYTTQTACTAAGSTWTAAGTASAFPATASTGGGMGALAAGVLRNSLCFGCHQSMAKTSNGTGANADLNNPTGLIVKFTGTTAGFSGHVLGNSFLNSPHARFTGSVTPNALGKYDLAANTAANYNSTFKGYSCYQSTSSASPGKTKADGTEIKDKATCEGLYGAGAWRADAGSAIDPNGKQGTCVTCHDVHQSLFVEGQEGLRKECVSCHDNTDFATAVPGTAQASIINHPTGAGTPAGDDPEDPCVVCHMPKPTPADFPMHVWRINSDAAYSTFPTKAAFDANTQKIANAAADSKGYAKAVWVDLDLACGQCHNGAVAEAPVFTKAQMVGAAKVMHGGAVTNTDCMGCHNTAQGDKRAVNQGVDHHNGSCVTCHPKPHSGNPAMPAFTAVITYSTTTNTGSSSYHKYIINDNLMTSCLTCHSSPVTRSSDSATLPAIVRSGAGDNHHGGHAVIPGQGGAEPNDPGLRCVGCHGGGVANGVLNPDGSTVGVTWKITGSGIPAATIGQGFTGGADATSSLCLACHDVIQSGASKDHHVGSCGTCHHYNGSFSGTYGAGVTTLAAGQDAHNCANCHTQSMTALSIGTGTTTKHPVGAPAVVDCESCHAFAGVIPTATASCGSCHQGVFASVLANQETLAANIHSASGGNVAKFTYVRSTTTNLLVNFNAGASVCPSGSCSYTWSFGGSGVTTSTTFLSAATTTVTLTVSGGGSSANVSLPVTPRYVSPASPISFVSLPTGTQLATGFTYTFGPISSYVSGGSGTVTVRVTWGDGKQTTVRLGIDPDTISHVYARYRTAPMPPFRIVMYAADSGVTVNNLPGRFRSIKNSAATPVLVAVNPYTIEGLVTNNSGTPIPYAIMTLKQGVKTVKRAIAGSTGIYTFKYVVPEQAFDPLNPTTPYTVSASKYKYTFSAPQTMGLIGTATTPSLITGPTVTSEQ